MIPWGYGIVKYDNLVDSNPTIIEKYVDGRTELHLTLDTSSGLKITAVLDPTKDYALFSSLIINPNGSQTFQQYSDYQLVAGAWIPSTILVERYESATGRLLSRNIWNFTKISAEKPSDDDFKVTLANGALVQYTPDIGSRPLTYRYSETVDIDSLISEKLSFEDSRETSTQNCATATMKHVANQLGKTISDQMLAALVSDTNNESNLYDIKQLARSLGLYAYAIKTDLATLKSLTVSQAILHIPGKRHFVALDRIDDSDIWLVDLSANKFYYRVPVDFFDMDWPDGIALLLSTEPIWFDKPISELSDIELVDIKGNSGYQCTRPIQICAEYPCEAPECDGYYEVLTSLLACDYAESGSCSYEWFFAGIEAPCIEHWDPNQCNIDFDEMVYYYMKACDNGDCNLW